MTKTTVVSTAALISLLLSGCNNVLDFRNAEISNNKIYESGKNTGFSGKVTNIPLNKIPFGEVVPVSNMIGKVTGNKVLNDLIYLNSLPVVKDGGVICDSTTNEGILNGETSCKASASGNPIFNLSFKNNSIDGKIFFFYPNKNSAKFAEANYTQGQANGSLMIYGIATGKTIYKVGWENGVPNGKEEAFDENTGKVTFAGNLVNGKYEGETTRYTPDGAIVEKLDWKNGIPQKNSPPSAAATQDCTDLWMAAFRKEQGAEAAISSDQLDEWQGWCNQGKKPNP